MDCIIIPTMEKPVGIILLKSIFKLKDKEVKINPIMSSEYPTAAKRPKYSVLDTKTQIAFNFKAPDLGGTV